MSENKDFLPLKEFANKVHYSERSIRQMCIDGKIRAYKLGHGSRKWLIPESEISRLQLKRQKRHLVMEDGIYESEKIMDIPPWVKNINNTKLKR